MSDEYQPALTMPAEPDPGETAAPEVQAQPEPATRQTSAARTAEVEAREEIDDRPEDTARGPRQVSSKVRAMFKDIAKRLSESDAPGGPDDLVPMDASAPSTPAAAPAQPAAATPAQPAATQPAGSTALPQLKLPNPAAAAPQPDPGRAAEEQKRLLLEQREKALEARAAEIEARLKTLPSREKLAESPGAALSVWLKEEFGVDDSGMRDLVTDLMTELSETYLGTKLPDEVKAGMQGRKAVRSVQAYKASLDAKERALAEQRAAQEKAAREAEEKRTTELRDRELVTHIESLLAPHAQTFRFLADPKLTRGLSAGVIVHEVYKEQQKLFNEGKTTQAPDLATAAKFADDYYKSQAEAAARDAAYFQSLLAPAAPAAPQPAKQQPSPGGVSGPAPTTQPRPAAPQQPTTTETDASDLPFTDRQERRRQSLAKIKARYLGGA